MRVWNSNSLETICVIGVDYFEDAVFALAFSNKVSEVFGNLLIPIVNAAVTITKNDNNLIPKIHIFCEQLRPSSDIVLLPRQLT